MPDLALGDELGHRADALVDRHAGIREVQVPEVDRIDAQAAEASLQRLAGALRAGVDEDLLRVVVRHRVRVLARLVHDAPLRRELHLVAPALDRARDELLVVAGAVGVGGVDQRGARVDRVPQRRQAVLLVAVAVHAVDQRHRAVADCRGGQSIGSKRACLHASAWSPATGAISHWSCRLLAIGFPDTFRTRGRHPPAPVLRRGRRARQRLAGRPRPQPLAVFAERGAAQARDRARRRAARALGARRRADRRRRGAARARPRRDRAVRRGPRGRPQRRARPERPPAGRVRGDRGRPALDPSARPLPHALPGRPRRAAPLRVGRGGRRPARRRVRHRVRLAARRPDRAGV